MYAMQRMFPAVQRLSWRLLAARQQKQIVRTVQGQDRSELSTEKTIRMYERPILAQLYTKYRPTYPIELWNKIFAFSAKAGVGDGLAVDLACGSGQSTFDLGHHFRQTVGVDISKAQIECALEKANTLGRGDVEFVVCPASKLPFEDESVDLMTCSQAWYFLDPNAVFGEIDRVLKKPGVLAVYCYGRPVLPLEKCDKLFHDFSSNMIWQEGPYGNVWQVVNQHHCRNMKLPYPLAEQHDIHEESTMTLETLVGFIRSVDSYQEYCKQHPGNTYLEDTIEEMKRLMLLKEGVPLDVAVSTSLADVTFCAKTPFHLLLTSKS